MSAKSYTGLIIVFVGVLLCYTSANAQKETFEYFKFTAPAGFTRKQESSYLAFIKFNEKKTHYVEFILYTSRNGNEDINEAFRKEWGDLVKKATSVEAPSAIKGEEENGWKTVYGSVIITISSGPYSQSLVTLAGHGKVTSISIRYNSDKFAKDAEAFLSEISMIIPTTPVPSVATPATTNTPVQTTPIVSNPVSGKYKGQNIAGVWRGIGTTSTSVGVTNAAGTNFSAIYYGSATQVKQIVFMEDGSFCFVYPMEGLLSYVSNRAKNPDYWGTYQIIDNENGKVKAGTSEVPYQIKNGSLLFDRTEFKKQARNDHQKLEGTFTAEINPDRWKSETTLEPTVSFKSDGTFNDQGAFYYIRHVRGYTEDTQDNNYGSGRYDIVNYTIVFSYTDGRKIEMAFLDFGPQQIGLNKSLLAKK